MFALESKFAKRLFRSDGTERLVIETSKKSPDNSSPKCKITTLQSHLYFLLFPSRPTMPRSATDATRFTSTTPHASAIPPSAANLQSSSSLQKQQQQRKAGAGPVGETPLEKVKRLRAAADRARDAQISTFDKLIVRGRVWADFAHRATTLFLIGATGMLAFLLLWR